MTLKLYELVGAEDRRSSPFCWSCRLALAHKGLEPELIGVRYTDKKAIAFSGQDKVPILVDGDNVVPDSFQIACYLERAYPDAPALFGGAIGCAEARFVNEWVNTAVHPRLSPLIIRDAYDWVHEDDRKYFRETRTKWLRKNFDELQADRDAKVLEFRETLAPARATLGHPRPPGLPLWLGARVCGLHSVRRLPVRQSGQPVQTAPSGRSSLWLAATNAGAL